MSKNYGKGLMPGPVYEATLEDGTTARMSFYSESGKPIDFNRGRRLVAQCYGRPRDELGYVTSAGMRLVSDLKPGLWRHTCKYGEWNRDAKKYDQCGHVWECEDMDPQGCPKCGRGDFWTIKTERADENGVICQMLVYEPAEIVDGYVDIPGAGRIRDPYFSGEAAPLVGGAVRKGKAGIALVQHVLRQLDRDDSHEARRAAELLRREFCPQFDGVAA